MIRPQRIKIERGVKGWRLQEVSLALNGLPAVKVDRSTKHGNPFLVGKRCTPAQAVAAFKRAIEDYAETRLWLEFNPADLSDLRGKNLACWCKPDQPCHADVLLKLANPE